MNTIRPVCGRETRALLVTGEKGSSDCPKHDGKEIGHIEPISSERACWEASQALDKEWAGAGEWNDYPSGCFWNHNGKFYYNENRNGKNTNGYKDQVRTVCLKYVVKKRRRSEEVEGVPEGLDEYDVSQEMVDHSDITVDYPFGDEGVGERDARNVDHVVGQIIKGVTSPYQVACEWDSMVRCGAKKIALE